MFIIECRCGDGKAHYFNFENKITYNLQEAALFHKRAAAHLWIRSNLFMYNTSPDTIENTVIREVQVHEQIASPKIIEDPEGQRYAIAFADTYVCSQAAGSTQTEPDLYFSLGYNKNLQLAVLHDTPGEALAYIVNKCLRHKVIYFRQKIIIQNCLEDPIRFRVLSLVPVRRSVSEVKITISFAHP